MDGLVAHLTSGFIFELKKEFKNEIKVVTLLWLLSEWQHFM